MGYGTRNNGQIRTFAPDDTDKTLYIEEGATLQELVEACRMKWGTDWRVDQIRIDAEYIHTDCLGFDRYDPFDYTNYLRITKEK